MKAPNLPSFSESWPLPQVGQARGSPPSARGGKMCGPSSSLSASRTSVVRSSLVSPTAAEKSRQKSRRTCFQSISLVGDAVELLLEVGGEVVFDVAAEEALQEGDDQAPLVLGDEPLLLDADVFALPQHGEDRGVGRGPADAELLHALDQARLGVARRRLGEMLVGRCARRSSGSPALIGGRRPSSSSSSAVGRRGLLVERQEAVELHHLAGGAQVEPARADRGAMSTVVRSSSADSIWLATVRIQISS